MSPWDDAKVISRSKEKSRFKDAGYNNIDVCILLQWMVMIWRYLNMQGLRKVASKLSQIRWNIL